MQKKNSKQKTDAWLHRYDFSKEGRDTVNTGNTTFKWFLLFLIKIGSNHEGGSKENAIGNSTS